MLGGGLGYGRLKPDVVAQAERVWCVLLCFSVRGSRHLVVEQAPACIHSSKLPFEWPIRGVFPSSSRVCSTQLLFWICWVCSAQLLWDLLSSVAVGLLCVCVFVCAGGRR